MSRTKPTKAEQREETKRHQRGATRAALLSVSGKVRDANRELMRTAGASDPVGPFAALELVASELDGFAMAAGMGAPWPAEPVGGE